MAHILSDYSICCQVIKVVKKKKKKKIVLNVTF